MILFNLISIFVQMLRPLTTTAKSSAYWKDVKPMFCVIETYLYAIAGKYILFRV